MTLGAGVLRLFIPTLLSLDFLVTAVGLLTDAGNSARRRSNFLLAPKSHQKSL